MWTEFALTVLILCCLNACCNFLSKLCFKIELIVMALAVDELMDVLLCVARRRGPAADNDSRL